MSFFIRKKEIFFDKFINFTNNFESSDIRDTIIKHININNYEKQFNINKELFNIIPSKRWKRIKSIDNNNNNNINININNKSKKKLYNCSKNKNKKIYKNNKRSVQYK